MIWLLPLLWTLVFGIIVFKLYSGMTWTHLFKLVRCEVNVNYRGFVGVIEDILMRNKNVTDLPLRRGRVAIVTGGSRGIGVEVVRSLLKCEVEVIIGCRNTGFGESIAAQLNAEYPNAPKIKVFLLDVGSFESVKQFSKNISLEYPKIHYLFNNAGILFVPYQETADGFESQFAVNYLGHFLLTHLLLPNIEAAGGEYGLNARIINVTSIAHFAADGINFEDINLKKDFVTSSAYAQSKFAQLIFSNYLDRLLKQRNANVQVHAVHPGVVNTDIFDGTPLRNIAPWLPYLFFKNVKKGAIPILHAALSERLEGRGGNYISNCRIKKSHKLTTNSELQEKFYEFSCNLVNISPLGKS